MRVFKHMNTSGKDVCPVCGTKEDKETVLIGIVGTEKGNNMQAVQVHLECLDLVYDKDREVFYQILRKKIGKVKN